MIGNKNVTNFRWKRRPRPIYPAGAEKNRPDHKAAEKAERPIARGNRGFCRGIIRRFHGLRRLFGLNHKTKGDKKTANEQE
jgi:hypothetical protein